MAVYGCVWLCMAACICLLLDYLGDGMPITGLCMPIMDICMPVMGKGVYAYSYGCVWLCMAVYANHG